MGFNAGGSFLTSGAAGGDRNTFVGRASGFAMINGQFNTFLGCDAGLQIASGSSNTFLGEHAGWHQISGNNNVFVGSHAGAAPAAGGTGENNTFVGTFCGSSNLNGDDNCFMGTGTGGSCNTGERNSFFGKWAGLTTLDGNDNVALGYRAGRFNRHGNNNTYLGTDAGVPSFIPFQSLDNVTAVGFDATARASNTMILGNNSVFVGIGLSNDATPANGPQNKLEIDAGLNGTGAQPNGTFGASGLRFRDLHLGNVASIANGYCLSVTPLGDVILVPDQTGGFGAPCAAPFILTQQSAVDLNGNMFHFLGSNLNSRVTIGGVCNNFVPAKLYVGQQSGSTNGTFGVFVLNTDQSIGQIVYGVFANVSPIVSSGGDKGYTAGAFYASGSGKRNIGVEGFANGPSSNGTTNFGGYFTSNSGVSNVGVYAEAPHGVFPAPPNGNDWAIWAEGDILFNGTMTGMNNVTSDQMFKTNVDSISDALSLLSQIHPHTYYFDTLNSYGLNFNSEIQYGMIAQEVEPIMPELVSMVTRPAGYDTLGNEISPSVSFKTLNYDAFIAILIAGMQEQQTQIDSLQSQINSCCSYNSRMSNNINQQDVTLTDTKSIVLNQNVPNPFAEQTTISFLLPESVVKAQMLFYDAQGKLIKAVDLDGRGAGQLNVFADDLSNGVYSYALVADGEVIDTKQMVKTK